MTHNTSKYSVQAYTGSISTIRCYLMIIHRIKSDLNVLYVSILDKCAALNAPTQCSATTAMLLSCRSWPWSDTDLGSWALTCLWQRLWYRSTFRKPWLRTRWHIKSIRLHTWVATQESNSSLSNIYGLMKILALNLANNNTTTKMEKADHTVKTEHDKIIIQSRMVRWRCVGTQWLFVSFFAFFHWFLVSYFECFSRKIPQTKMLSCAHNDK